MTDLPAYGTGLTAAMLIVAITLLLGRGDVLTMGRTALVILANWVLGVTWVNQTGDYTPWGFNILIDTASAIAIMWRPAGKVQGYIGLFYMMQITAHIAFGLRIIFEIPTDAIFYYHAITYVAWAQLAALGAWAGGIWMGDLLHRIRGFRPARAGRTGASDLRDPPK